MGSPLSISGAFQEKKVVKKGAIKGTATSIAAAL